MQISRNRLNLTLTVVVFVSALFLLWLGSRVNHYAAVFGVGVAFSYLFVDELRLLHEAAHSNLHSESSLESSLRNALRDAVSVSLEHDSRHTPRASFAKPHRLRDV